MISLGLRQVSFAFIAMHHIGRGLILSQVYIIKLVSIGEGAKTDCACML